MLVSNIFYNIFLFLYGWGIRLYARFNSKAKKWVEGRRDWKDQYGDRLHAKERRIWIHCSSLGEFEQGRPLIESIKKNYGAYKIVLSFFSPSGFEIRKDYDLADYVFYLPLDGKENARSFIAALNPELVIFVKYEFWYYFLHRLHELKIPVVLISAVFRHNQPFFKWYGGLYRRMIGFFDLLFVQDEASFQLIRNLGYENRAVIAGDTRYDRVVELANMSQSIPALDKFKMGKPVLIAGSTWPEDEQVLAKCLPALAGEWKIIIAPHEVEETHLDAIEKQFHRTVRFSALMEGLTEEQLINSDLLIIDNIGMLSTLYAYADIAFIGGGFQQSGIHNILEPAVFGLPIVFGPHYKKFLEANQLITLNLAFAIHDATGGADIIQKLSADKPLRLTIQHSLKQFVQRNTGATNIILHRLSEENWLK
jgi:3-deoxy-D-manno-octulosonic-acid transferase